MERISGGKNKGREQGSAGLEKSNIKIEGNKEDKDFKNRDNKDSDKKFLSKRNNSSTNLNKINNNNNNDNNSTNKNDNNNKNNIANKNKSKNINKNKNKSDGKKNPYKNSRCVDCIVVAPEGTRSLSGQLLAFKKGPFYLWLQMGGGERRSNG